MGIKDAECIQQVDDTPRHADMFFENICVNYKY